MGCHPERGGDSSTYCNWCCGFAALREKGVGFAETSYKSKQIKQIFIEQRIERMNLNHAGEALIPLSRERPRILRISPSRSPICAIAQPTASA
jgi:hypothetical protein